MFNVQLYLKCQESWYQPSRSPTIWFRFPAPSQTISRVPVIKKVNGNYCMDVWNISGWCSSNIHLSNTLRFGFTKSKEACKRKVICWVSMRFHYLTTSRNVIQSAGWPADQCSDHMKMYICVGADFVMIADDQWSSLRWFLNKFQLLINLITKVNTNFVWNIEILYLKKIIYILLLSGRLDWLT